jgi:hypothetical protein
MIVTSDARGIMAIHEREIAEFHSPAAGGRDAFYYHYYGVGGAPQSDNWIAYHESVGMRTKTAELVYYHTWKNGPFWEYCDLTQDPQKMRDVYGESCRRDGVAGLKTRMRELTDKYQDTEVVQRLDAEKKGNR